MNKTGIVDLHLVVLELQACRLGVQLAADTFDLVVFELRRKIIITVIIFSSVL